jgi:GT2 family glycosyltransferase
MTPSPRATVAVLSWNGRQHLDTCLSSLLGQTYRDREIVLVDNGSSDGTAEYVRATFPEVRIVRLEENAGVCGGLNFGVTQARGELIALINNDTEADADWLRESIRALDAHPEAGFTASRMRLFYRRTELDTAGDLLFRNGHPAKRGWLMPDSPEYDEDAWIFGACAGAAVYRRSMLEDTGLFDEDFFGTLEDFDLSFRAQLMGYRCRYVASAIVYHKVGATEGLGMTSPQLLYRVHRNRWFALIKNLPGPLWIRYLGDIVAAEALVLAAASRGGRLGLFFRSRVEVLGQLPRLLRKRRAVQRRRRVPVAYLDSLIGRNWLAHRRAEKRREVELAVASRRAP